MLVKYFSIWPDTWSIWVGYRFALEIQDVIEVIEGDSMKVELPEQVLRVWLLGELLVIVVGVP